MNLKFIENWALSKKPNIIKPVRLVCLIFGSSSGMLAQYVEECAKRPFVKHVSIENYPTNNRFDISALGALDNDANAELKYRLSNKV